MAGDITTVQVSSGDVTSLSVSTDISNITVASDITGVIVQTNDTTVLTQSSGTINLASLSLATAEPEAVARSGSVGVSALAARADHVHSAANLLMDGGNY
jgi:hypothetical protein